MGEWENTCSEAEEEPSPEDEEELGSEEEEEECFLFFLLCFLALDFFAAFLAEDLSSDAALLSAAFLSFLESLFFFGIVKAEWSTAREGGPPVAGKG